MDAAEQRYLARAFAFALREHGPQKRKGSGVPYVSHLLQVAGLVQEHGGDATQTVAALLHDTLEDCVSVDDALLEREFGGEVAVLVRACSDTRPGEDPAAKRPWKERKREFLDRLHDGPRRALLIAACDKRHNLGALVADLRAHGPETLERFNAGADDQRWYFDRFIRSAEAHLPVALVLELRALLDEFDALLSDGDGVLTR